MKREKRASRAWPAGCPLVPGGALGGGDRRPLPPHPCLKPSSPATARGRGQRPGRAHLPEAHTRGPSAKAQLNAGRWGGGERGSGGGRGTGRPKLAFPWPSGARSGRGRTKGAGRRERRVCRRIDLQMRLCQRIKAGQTPDPAPAPPPARPSAPRGPGQAWHRESWARLCLFRRQAGELRGIPRTKLSTEPGATALASRALGVGAGSLGPSGPFIALTPSWAGFSGTSWVEA